MGCSQSKSTKDTVAPIPIGKTTIISEDSSVATESSASSRAVIMPAISSSYRLYMPEDAVKTYFYKSKHSDRTHNEYMKCKDQMVLTKTHNRQGKSCVKATHPEMLSFDMAILSLKDAKRDAKGRLIVDGSHFWRSPEVEALRVSDYEADKETYSSTADRLHIESFGWEAVKGKDGKTTAVRGKNATREIVWMKNKYPYAWEDGVEHFVCWSTDGPALSLNECIYAIQENVGPDKEVVWFTNSMKNRSVPGIDHIQVIVRPIPSLTVGSAPQ